MALARHRAYESSDYQSPELVSEGLYFVSQLTLRPVLVADHTDT